METLFWEYPYTAGDMPFGTTVGKNIFAPLHDHLAGAWFDKFVEAPVHDHTSALRLPVSYSQPFIHQTVGCANHIHANM